MSSAKTIWSDCRACGRSTRHDVLFQHEEESDPYIYHDKETWQVVRCLGCTTTGFRHRRDDYENVSEDHEGNLHHEIEITAYPRVIRNTKNSAASISFHRL